MIDWIPEQVAECIARSASALEEWSILHNCAIQHPTAESTLLPLLLRSTLVWAQFPGSWWNVPKMAPSNLVDLTHVTWQNGLHIWALDPAQMEREKLPEWMPRYWNDPPVQFHSETFPISLCDSWVEESTFFVTPSPVNAN